MMTTRHRRIFVFWLVAVLALSAAYTGVEAQAWSFGKNKLQYSDFEWLVLKTPHFDVHFIKGYEELAARTAVILEYGYGKLSNDFSHNIKWRIPVILYGSHADFQQTNILWSNIPEGVQAFAEPNRRRMVIHYSGEDEDFAHTTIHELVHIFSFDIIYGNLLRSVFTRNMLFQIPLWFMEGLAEYYSIGYDETAEMFMRDAIVFDYISDLPYAYGYMAYKSGQAAIHYLHETYGPEKVVEIMDHLRYQRSMDMALRSALGVAPVELSREWKKHLRRKYWPIYADKKEADEYGRKLTDHLKDHHYMNTKPVFSPDGEYIVYFSDRKGLDGIYLMNALSGKIEKRLLTGSMSERFESIRSMKSRLTYSPDGSRLSFVAKSHGKDRLFVMEVPSSRIIEEIELPLDFFHSPSWSPRGDEIAIVGTIFGQTDLYLYNLQSREFSQLTSDSEGERDPAWFPDSRRLVFTRFPVSIVQPEFCPDSTGIEKLNEVDFRLMDNLTHIDGDIWSYDLESGSMDKLISTPGNDLHPVVMPGEEEIIFTSNERGVSNLYRGSIVVGSYYRFTDVLGGLFTPTYSPEKDRLAFTAFSYAGYDIYVMEGFSAKSSVSYSTGSPKLSEEGWSQEIRPEDYLAVGSEPGSPGGTAAAAADAVEASGETAPDSVMGVIATAPDSVMGVIATAPDSVTGVVATVPDSVTAAVTSEDHDIVILTSDPDSARVSVRIEGGAEVQYEKRPIDEISARYWPIYQDEMIPDIVIEQDMDEDIPPDSLSLMRALACREIGTVKPYSLKFSPDYVGNGMGLFFSTGFGFGMVNQIAFSDLLGDHHLYFSFNIYRAFEDSDLMFSYYYLKKRIDYAVGAFQFKNYLNSRVSSIGETFLDYRYFTERNYGIFGLVSFPFSTFTRLDLEFQGFISEREFFDTVELGEFGGYTLVPGEKTTRRLVQPTLSLVHDSAYYGLFGPVIGSRWMLSISRTIPFSGEDVSRTTGFFDYRKYIPLFYRNYFALRTMGAVSDGNDNRMFFLGGPLTMRGYDYLQFSGSRMCMGSLEYRYPLLDALIFGWPGRWGITNIGGTVFMDTGAVWGPDTYVEPLDSRIKPRIFEDVRFYSDFGVGFYMRFGFLILNFQIGWPTDFSRTGDPMYHFYLGPMF